MKDYVAYKSFHTGIFLGDSRSEIKDLNFRDGA